MKPRSNTSLPRKTRAVVLGPFLFQQSQVLGAPGSVRVDRARLSG